MTQQPLDSPGKEEPFPGWNTSYDISLLVQLFEPSPRSSMETEEVPRTDAPFVRRGLLEGKQLLLRPAESSTVGSSSPVEDRVTHVSRIPVTRKAAKERKSLLIPSAIFLASVLVLAAIAWLVMKFSDFSSVETVAGSMAQDVTLSVDLGQTLPGFTGLLLKEDPDRWGDTFSDQDMIGTNTVLFVWGSWNEDLLSWSRVLNYQRLVSMENARVQFVGLNLDSSREAALRALNEDLQAWPHIFNQDPRQEDADRPMRRLGIQSSPLILMVDAVGRLRAQGLTPDEVEEVYGKLFE